MTVRNIISQIFKGSVSDPNAIDKGSEEERKARKDAKLVDLAHEAMQKRAAGDHVELEALVRMGWPHVQKEKFKNKVRKKVWDVVKEDFGVDDAEMVNEITDRIVDVSEADEYYKNMFDKEEA